MVRNNWLVAGGALSATAAILHVVIIIGGPAWYRFFGAGEDMARAAEQGSSTPALVTAAIAGILMAWALYAFPARALSAVCRSCERRLFSSRGFISCAALHCYPCCSCGRSV